MTASVAGPEQHMKPLRLTTVVLAVMTVALAAASAYAAFLVSRYAAILSEATPYNAAWAASQSVGELARLEQRVAAYGLPDGGVDMDEVQLRLGIVRNRLSILRAGAVADLVQFRPDLAASVDEVSAVLDSVEALLADPGADRQDLARQGTAILAPAGRMIARFASGINQVSSERITAAQELLLNQHRNHAVLALALVLCGGTLIALLAYSNRLIGRAHQRQEKLTHELNEAKEHAEAANRAKSRFLGTMSHELRTPLNAIIGFAEMIELQIHGPAGVRKYPEYATYVAGSGRHMLRLVDDILTMARLDAQAVRINPGRVDVGAVVQDVCTMVRAGPLGRNRTIAVTGARERLELTADEDALRRMVANLLQNALKFSSPGTVVRIDSGITPGGEVEIAVTDEGVGMSQEEMALAVQPFVQIDNNRRAAHEGAGLGLAIVKGLVEAHGGRLVIRSRVGEGTRAAVVFPAASRIVEPIPEQIATGRR